MKSTEVAETASLSPPMTVLTAKGGTARVISVDVVWGDKGRVLQ
jgi:hypothetical protein